MTLLARVPDDDPRDEYLAEREGAAEREQSEQIVEARRAVGLPANEYLDWPWQSLARTMGGMAPGTLGFVCAASGAGKTSFLMSAARRWCLAGRHIYYAGFETRAHILRTQWAARSLGLNAGDILSGRAASTWADWATQRRRLVAQLEMQDADPIRFAPFRFVDLRTLDRMFQDALDFEADVLVIDHIDHIDGQRGNQYESSVAAVRRVLTLAQDTELRVVAASQTNLANAGTDRLRFHRPVRREHVKLGNQKIEVADWMLGLYRPLKRNLTKGMLQDWRNGVADLSTILEPGVTELNVMKHRAYGSREGERVRLGFARGEVLDNPVVEPHLEFDGWKDRGADG